MSRTTIKVDQEVLHCDFCGQPTSGMYSTCDLCGRDICRAHYSMGSEEECYCVECAALGYPEIYKRQSEQAAKRVAAFKAELAKHTGQLKIDGVWKDKKEVIAAVSKKLYDAIGNGDMREV